MLRLKKRLHEEEGVKEKPKAYKTVQKAQQKAKEEWLHTQRKELDTCLNKNNSKEAYQLVKELTSERQGRATTIQNESGECFTEEQEILSRCTEYCSKLYSYESYGDNTISSGRKVKPKSY